MTALIIYLVFTYLFMGMYVLNNLKGERHWLLWIISFVIWMFSPVLVPVMLGGYFVRKRIVTN